jgi:hypothetical protein
MVVVPVGFMEKVVLANNDWVDHRPRGDLETQSLTSKEPTDNQVREFANSFEKSNLAGKVKIITKLAYKWPKAWLEVRMLLKSRNKKIIAEQATHRRTAAAKAKAIAKRLPRPIIVNVIDDPPAVADIEPDIDNDPPAADDDSHNDSYDETSDSDM